MIRNSSRILGFGHSIPEERIDNSILERQLGLIPGSIEQKTGIKSRYWAKKNETLTEIATKAGEMALRNANINRDEISLTLLATSTPDHLLPPSSPMLTHRLNLLKSGSIDLTGACAGFLYAFVLADAYVNLHSKPVLIVAANLLSRRINMEDKDTAIIFGDAAGAIVLAPAPLAEKKTGILGIELASDGSKYDLITVPAGGSKCPAGKNTNPNDFYISFTNGREIFSNAVKMMTKSAQGALKMAQLTPHDIDRFILHQANYRINRKVCEQIGIPNNKVVESLGDFGNSSAATIPLSLSLENIRRPFKSGERLLLSAAGAGMTGGSVVFMNG